MVEKKPLSDLLSPDEIIRILTPDIVFVMDATGSMDRYISGVRESLLSIIESIKEEDLSQDIMFGSIYYRDIGDKGMMLKQRYKEA